MHTPSNTSSRLLISFIFLVFSSSVFAANPMILMETSLGNVTIELYPDNAPKTVENFLRYTNEGFYSNTIFHRVIKNFMNQGGGTDINYKDKKTHAPIINEADNGLKNNKGTIAMARTNNPNSATSQFFINTADNTSLNHTSKSSRGWGYTVFGKVTAGMNVIDDMSKVKTGEKKQFRTDAPLTEVVIRSMKVIPEVKPGK